MTLEDEVLDSLQDLGYPLLEALENDVSLLTQMQTFSAIISWISIKLQTIRRLESLVNPIKDDSEAMSLKIELNSLLRELNSPLIDMSFADNVNKLVILNSLCGHVMTAQMDAVNHKSVSNKSMTIMANESQTAKDLKYILITLGMGRPPDSVASGLLFKKISEKLNQRLTQQKQTIEDSLLLPEGLTLSSDQWKSLEAINEDLKKDYTIRREMLLRRCDCTVGSFKWKSSSDETKAIEKQIDDKYESERRKYTITPNVVLANALAARQSDCDHLINSVVSNKPTNCLIQVPQTKGMANKGIQQRLHMQEIHKHIIGSVPDRGGRPNEQIAPPKESFSQQQNQRDNPQRGRGRGGQRGGSGGGYSRGGGGGPTPNVSHNTSRIQGTGWAPNSGQRYSNNSGYDDQRGGYQQNNKSNIYTQQHHQQPYQQRTNQYSQESYGQQYSTNYTTNQYSNQQTYDSRQSYNSNNNDNYYSNNTYGDQRYQQHNIGNRGRGGGGGGGGRRY